VAKGSVGVVASSAEESKMRRWGLFVVMGGLLVAAACGSSGDEAGTGGKPAGGAAGIGGEAGTGGTSTGGTSTGGTSTGGTSTGGTNTGGTSTGGTNTGGTSGEAGAAGSGGSPVLGCDCGSTLAESPCLGNSVSHLREKDPLPASTIEFTFACDGGPCACGKFANGYDYWVAPVAPGGTVSIVGLTPAATGAADASLRNGWVANPSATVTSTFMDGRLGDMTDTGTPLNPDATNPFEVDTASMPVTTVVKSHSMLETGDSSCGGTDDATGLSRHCFWQAAVLTILGEVPPDAGSTVLRPPMTGTEKPLISTSAIDFGALPNLPLPVRKDGTTVEGSTWESALDRMGPPKVEWGAGGNWTYWQYMPPMYNFSSNPSGYPPRSMEGLLGAMQLLAIDGTGHEQDKRLLAVRSVQWGIDYYYMWKARGFGAMYKPNGGHAVGRYLPTIVAAALLTGPTGDQMKQDLLRVNNGTGDKCGFDISGELTTWPDTGRTLYGYFNIPGCGGYSDYTKQTNSNYVDPAHLGDNGRLEVNANNDANDVNSCFGAYQAITIGPTLSTANLVRAIPAARAIAYDPMFTYVERMVDHGAYCRPDHTPPATYARAFPTCEGGAAAGEQCRNGSDCPGGSCGSFSMQYTSWLARNMWAKYASCYDDNSCPGM
jgi:hypothetical protein